MAKQKLVTIIDVDTRKFRNGMNRTKAFAKDLAANILKLGVIVAAAFTTAVIHTAKFGDEIDKVSRRTGIAVDELQVLQLATKLAGTEFAAIEKGLKTFNSNLFDFKDGGGEAKDAFNLLKLSFKDLANIPVSKQLELILSRVNLLDRQFEKSAALADLLGARAGVALLPLADSLEKTLALARKKIVPFSPEQIKQSADLIDNIEILKFQFGGIIRILTLQAFPRINAGLVKLSDRVGKFVKSAAFKDLAEEVKLFAFGVAKAFSQFSGGEVSITGIVDGMKAINKELDELNSNNTFGTLFETLKGIGKVLAFMIQQIKQFFKLAEAAVFGAELVFGEIKRSDLGQGRNIKSSIASVVNPFESFKNLLRVAETIGTTLKSMEKEEKAPS